MEFHNLKNNKEELLNRSTGSAGTVGPTGPTGPTERLFKSSNKIIIDSS